MKVLFVRYPNGNTPDSCDIDARHQPGAYAAVVDFDEKSRWRICENCANVLQPFLNKIVDASNYYNGPVGIEAGPAQFILGTVYDMARRSVDV